MSVAIVLFGVVWIAGVIAIEAFASRDRAAKHAALVKALNADLEAFQASLLTALKPHANALDVLAIRALDYARAQAGGDETRTLVIACDAAKLFDLGDDGQRDYTDAQIRVAVGAAMERAKRANQ